MSIPFLAGQDGYHAYRIPAVLVTDGVVLAFAEGRVNGSGDGGDIDIVLRRSLDGGTTWEPLQVVQTEGTATAYNPTVVRDPASGDVLLLWCRRGGGDTSAEIRRGEAPAPLVFVQRSADGGVTWSSKLDITAQARASWMRMYGTGPGHGIALTAGPHAGLGLWTSADEGRTWMLRHQVTGLPAAYSALALDGDHLAVLYETGDSGPYERIELVRVPLAALS